MDDWRRRAESLIDLGRPADALAPLAAGLGEHPDDADGLLLLALAHLGLDQPAEALAAGDRLVAVRPDDEVGHRLRAAALSGLRRGHDALLAATEARRLAPGLWLTHAAYAQAAVPFPSHGQEALGAARHAVALEPGQPDAHFTLGVVSGALRHFEESESAYRRALALDPTHAAARNNLTSAAGYSPGLRRRVDGYAEALAQQPDLRVARANLSGLLLSFLRRLHLGGVAVLVVCTAIAQADGARPLRALVGAVALLGLLGATAWWLRALPRGVRLHWAGRIASSPALALLLAALVLVLAVACWAAFLPVPPWFARGVVRPLGLLEVVVLVLAYVRVRP